MADLYLLLRNNEESGPFTAAELKNLSLKAYDLVWVQGKSAAWRYPGEIDELKEFAPVVEEQPYDRFFKNKPGARDTNNKSREEKNKIGKLSENGPGTSPVKKPVHVAFPERMPIESQPVDEKPAVSDQLPKYNERTFNNFEADYARSRNSVKPVKEEIKSETKFRRSLDHLKHHYNNWLSRQVSKTDGLNKRALWMVPVFAILLALGIWIGLNWYSFPANQVFIPASHDPTSPKSERIVTKETKTGDEFQLTPSNKVNQSIDPPPLEKKTTFPNAGEQSTIAKEKSIVSPEIKTPENSIQKDKPVAVPKVNIKETGNTITRGHIRQTTLERDRIKTNNEIVKKEKPILRNEPVNTDTKSGNKSANTSTVSTLPKTSINDGSENTVQKQNLRYHVDDLINIDGSYTLKSGMGINPLPITLKNLLNKQLEVVSVEVQYLGNNNNVLNRETLYFKNIPAYGSIRLTAAGNGKGQRVGYKVLYISSRQGEFYYDGENYYVTNY